MAEGSGSATLVADRFCYFYEAGAVGIDFVDELMCGFSVEPGGLFLSNTDCSVCSRPLLHSHCPQVNDILFSVVEPEP
jgi:hypothetical protein